MSTAKYSSYVSDADLQNHLISCLKKRSIDQKFFYLGERADGFYEVVRERKNTEKKFLNNSPTMIVDAKKIKPKSFYPKTDFYSNFMKDRSYRKYKTCILGLACGDASKEKGLLEELALAKYKTPYYAIDTSVRMLELAEENIKNIDLPQYFIQADIISQEFKKHIKEETSENEIRVFAFLGGTFCNPNQTEIAESLYNMMGESDVLWVDMKTRDEITEENEEILRNKYLGELENESLFKWNFHLLEAVGIKPEDGKLRLAIGEEVHVGSKLFKYYFEFNKDVEIIIKDEKIRFLTGEWIMLQHIRVYHKPNFLKFMESMGFSLLDSEDSSRHMGVCRSQFLFMKKEVK